LLDKALEQKEINGFDLAPAFTQIGLGFSAAADNRFYQMSWQDLMGGSPGEPEPKRRFIEVSPHMDYSQLLPADAPMKQIRSLQHQLQLDGAHGIELRLTGEVPMEYEELLTATTGAGLALGSAMVMVAILLWLALRSARLVFAAVITLVYGLLMTAAFAAAAVGHLNLISVAFGVLYVGLGIDYALYLCMQYRELLGQGMPAPQALPQSAADVGGYMMVCAATTSLGFLAFIPTSFTAIAELGLIAGAGMFISLFLTLTVLPALLSLMPPDPAKVILPTPGRGRFSALLSIPYTHARTLWVVAALLGIGALFLIPKLRFDFNPLDLRDPKSESVSTFRALLADPQIPTFTLSVVMPDAVQAKAIAQKLAALPLVKQTLQLSDFIPNDQDQKLGMISDVNFVMGPDFASTPAPSITGNDTQDAKSIASLRERLAGYLPRATGNLQPAVDGLLKQVDRFEDELADDDSAGRGQLLSRLRESLLGALPDQMQGLKLALRPQAVSERNLPTSLVRRWTPDHQIQRVEIWPRERLDNTAAMQRFVDQVRTVAPSAVGPPVVALESGRAMVKSFRQAFIYSFVAITLLLLLLLRSFIDTLLVLVPLVLAGLLTAAGTVILHIPFNFANIIALPLILGVGVDYGVYIVQRGRAAASSRVNILQTSTARAVLFGALITMANFGNLALAKHPGMVSMGLLLTVGLFMTLLCALILLPSLLARRYGAPRLRRPGDDFA
jgi:hypothetical protein